MNISLEWLKDYIDITETPEQLAYLLTMTGLEVEGVEEVEKVKGGLQGLVVGEVLTCAKHPNADKLSVTTVDVGAAEPLHIVCGAPNVAQGQKVIVATVGAMLYPAEGEPFAIKKSKIRGELSEGMLCAEDEIGLGKSHDGIMVLNTTLPNGTPAAQYFNLQSDQVLSIGLTPNRVDAASHYGVARDVHAATGRALRFPEYNFAVAGESFNIAVEVQHAEACPRYSGLTITGVQVQPSPEWLQNRLKAIGLAPINNVVDITNFVLHSIGQPLHAFDADKIAGQKVVVRTVAEGTEFVTLDKVTRKLSANDLMICDAEKPMCIAGVFGGADSGITEQTTRIFLESAYFSPDYIRRTGMHHGLKTDASFRFERGTDVNLTVKALQWAATLITQIAGGKVASQVTDIYPNPIAPFEVKVTYKNIARLIGKTLDKAQIQTILTRLDIAIARQDTDGMTLHVAPYRVDVQREADVIEEILRVYGFNNVELSPYTGSTYLAEFPMIDKAAVRGFLTTLLAANGCNEMMNNSLTNPQYSQTAGLNAAQDVVILNYLSPELSVMRQTLLFSGLESVAHNINRRQTDLRLFEFGKVYQANGDKYNERNELAIFVTGNQQAETWTTKTTRSDFHSVVVLLEKIFSRLNIKGLEVADTQHPFFAYGLQYSKKGKTPIHAGLLKKSLAKQADVKQDVFCAIIDFDDLFKLADFSAKYQEIPRFPEVRRDLSLVIDKAVRFDDLRKIAFKAEKNLLQDVNVFDVYEGSNIGEGKKSYALSFTLLDKEQTLTDKVIDKTMEKLMQTLEKETGALVRK